MNTKDVETAVPVRELTRDKSVTLEYFIESSSLDRATIDMLKKYDRDGDGSFSKDEVVAIIIDLREAMQSNEILGHTNKLFKRLLIAATMFCVLLLTSMFGLSYAVAALTAKTDVQSNGLMTTSDGKSVIATDSSATKYSTTIGESGFACMDKLEVEDMLNNVELGRSVLFETSSVNGSHTVLDHMTGSVDIDTNTGNLCFMAVSGEALCLELVAECNAQTGRRKLWNIPEGCNVNNADPDLLDADEIADLQECQAGTTSTRYCMDCWFADLAFAFSYGTST